MRRIITLTVILCAGLAFLLTSCSSADIEEKENAEMFYIKADTSEFEYFDTEISPNLNEYLGEGILIGVWDDVIYFGQQEGQEYTVNCLAGYDSEIPKLEKIYKIDGCSYEIFHEIINGKIYIGYAGSDPNGESFSEIIEIDEAGDAKSIYKNYKSFNPKILFGENSLYALYLTDSSSLLERIALSDYSTSIIKETELYVDGNDDVTGDNIVCAGTFDDSGIYYAVMPFDGIGKTNYYYYDLLKNEEHHIMKNDDMPGFLSGDSSGNILMDVYSGSNAPAGGTIIYKNNDEYIRSDFEVASPVQRILSSSKLDERFIVCNCTCEIVIFDTEKKIYQVKQIADDSSEAYISDVKYNNGKIFYIEYSDEGANLITMEISDQYK